MLIIMNNGDIERVPQSLFHLKAARCRDIFQVDSTKGRGNMLHRCHNLIHILRCQTDRVRFYPGKGVKQDRLAFLPLPV